jgi:hypothetical protein
LLSDVDRCFVIGVPNEATPARLKYRLAAAVSVVGPPHALHVCDV